MSPLENNLGFAHPSLNYQSSTGTLLPLKSQHIFKGSFFVSFPSTIRKKKYNKPPFVTQLVGP